MLHRTDSFPSFLVPSTRAYLPHKLRSANEHHWLELEGSQILYTWHYNNMGIWITRAQMYTWLFLLKGCGTSTTSCTDRKFRPVNTLTHMTSIEEYNTDLHMEIVSSRKTGTKREHWHLWPHPPLHGWGFWQNNCFQCFPHLSLIVVTCTCWEC